MGTASGPVVTLTSGATSPGAAVATKAASATKTALTAEAAQTTEATPTAEATQEPAPRLRQDAARNRDRIITAACEVFAEHGVEAGVEEIARRAGVGVGTLYRRFPTKDHLLRQIAEDLLRHLLDAARAELGAADGGGLERTMRHSAALQAGKRGYMMRVYDAAIPADLRDAFRDALAELLGEAQRAGTIRPDVTAPDVIMTLWSLRGVIDMTAAVSPDAVQRHLDLIMAALRPGAAPLTHPPLTMAEVAEAGPTASR
jgi:AcrR family transcriptional regulator